MYFSKLKHVFVCTSTLFINLTQMYLSKMNLTKMNLSKIKNAFVYTSALFINLTQMYFLQIETCICLQQHPIHQLDSNVFVHIEKVFVCTSTPFINLNVFVQIDKCICLHKHPGVAFSSTWDWDLGVYSIVCQIHLPKLKDVFVSAFSSTWLERVA